MTTPLFFSGGTALKTLCWELASRRQLSIHLLTTHDSGGSSQKLRKALHMPAIGDIRNRLLALVPPAMRMARDFLSCRISARLDPDSARAVFVSQMTSPFSGDIPEKLMEAIKEDLATFYEAIGQSFDFANASLGNIALVGAWLNNGQDLMGTILRYAKLLGVIGQVAPACAQSAHLAAELADGSVFFGQHTFKHISKPIRQFWFTGAEPWSDAAPEPFLPVIHPCAARLIGQADLICYPMGSFYSSLLANLAPAGVGDAIARSFAQKVYIPNLGHDPEQSGLAIIDQVELIIETLRSHAPSLPIERIVNIIIVDENFSAYAGGFDDAQRQALSHWGIAVRAMPLASGPASHDAARLLDALNRIGP